MKDVKRPPKLGFDDPVLSKGIDYSGSKGIPKDPATSFTIQDREVVASVRLTDITGKHRLRWEWYTPDGKRYSSSGAYSIKASKDKYLREATAWHKLSILGENAANYTKGYWRVKIYLDKRLIASKPFEILERIEVADYVPPAIMLFSPVNNFETPAQKIILKGKITDKKDFAKLQIKLGDKVLYSLEDFKIDQEASGSVSVIEKEITLIAGPNDIIIEAVDMAGNKAKKTLTVVYKVMTAKLERKGKQYAVIIGIGKYKDKGIKGLKYATRDAQAIHDVLTNPRYGEVPAENVRMLLDEQATVQNIKIAIGTWLKRNARKKDTVTIFFAGHGAPEDEQTYWVTHDAKIDSLYGTALSNDEVVRMLNRVKAEKRIVFLDSCYSAATVEGTRALSIKGDPFKKFVGTGMVTITSSSGKQESIELDDFKHGVFTYYLVKALKGDSDENKDGIILLDEVWKYVKDRVEETASKRGKYQTPVMKTEHYAGDIVLSKDPVTLALISQKGKIDRMKKLWKTEQITVEQYNKAVKIIKAGKRDMALEAFLSGKMDLETFKITF
jgi:hypothetical protein